ncbi:MAG: hydrogenase large subunit [Crenarchaeota archaeon]|nr:hydrogenase large subunit [Thermoproteota archaeon]
MVIKVLEECNITPSRVARLREDTLLIDLDKSEIRDVVRCLVLEKGLHFATCVGVDYSGLSEGRLALIYILTRPRTKLVLRVLINENEDAPRVHDILPAAEWCEYEAYDLLGFKTSLPISDRFILHWGVPSNIRPLRKDFKHDVRLCSLASCKLVEKEGFVEVDPHHPFFYEHEDFLVKVVGNRIVDVLYVGSYINRGIEKVGESRLKMEQVPFIAERICGICGFTHSTAYCQAVESALNIDVPERARLERTLMLELERIESHLLLLALVAYAVGLRDIFLELLRYRELVMNACDVLVGNRKMYGLNIIGGVRYGFTLEQVRTVRELVEKLKDVEKVLDRLAESENVKKLKEVGVLPKDDAHKLGAVGPVARASGIDYDVRRDLPYAAYDMVDFEVPVMDSGDTYARIVVRYEETIQSIRIIEQVLSRRELVNGEIRAEYYSNPGKIGVGMTEAPRGENVHFIITGHDSKLYRWKVRAPTYANLAVLKRILIGESPKNAPIIIASLDPCLSCTDRLVKVRKW